LLDHLQVNGEQAARRRANHNFHEKNDAMVQRLFISMESDSYVRPHFHPESHKWEFFLVLRGRLDFLVFDDDGTLKERIALDADGPVRGLEIPFNTWHCTVVNEGSVQFLEVKEGPYVVNNDKHFAEWSPPEESEIVPNYLALLKELQPGQVAKL